MRFFLLAWLLSCDACAAALSNEDVASLHDAETMALMAYRERDAATPAAQFDRAAFCSIDAVLRRQDAGTLETNGVIVCQRTFK